MAPFQGFTADTFAAYTPEKWSSNVHNLARMRAKDNVLALCEAAQSGLDEELQGLARAASDEVPNITNHKKVDAQWVYWFRDAEARKALASFLEKTPLDSVKLFDIAPHDKHATLAVVVRETHVWTGLRLAPGATVDRRNFAAMLGKSWEREQLKELLDDLPDGAAFGVEGQTSSAAQVTLDTLARVAGRLGQDDPVFLLGHEVPAAEAIELGPDLADHIGRWLGTLVPAYRFIAWVPDNDHIGAGKRLREEKAEKQRQALGYRSGDRVRIISGVFAGKNGVVQTIDAKAHVKVQVGKMSVVLSGKDLRPAS